LISLCPRLISRLISPERAGRHYNAWKGDRWDFIPATPEFDPVFLKRISVNFLRHRLTGYEAHLADIYGKVGTDTAYPKIKAKVLDAIAAALSPTGDGVRSAKGTVMTYIN
jgi:hypothetical protein